MQCSSSSLLKGCEELLVYNILDAVWVSASDYILNRRESSFYCEQSWNRSDPGETRLVPVHYIDILCFDL